MDYTKDFEIQFRPLQLIVDYNPQFIDLGTEKIRIGTMNYMIKTPCISDITIIPPTDDEEDPAILYTKLSRALIELWQTNSEAIHKESIEEYQEQQRYKATNSLSDKKTFLHVLVTKEVEPAYIPLSTNLSLKFD